MLEEDRYTVLAGSSSKDDFLDGSFGVENTSLWIGL